jgi:hypothetical protein
MYSPLLHKLGDQELGVLALGQCPELALELARNHAPLLHGRVLDRRLDDAHRVVLEDKVLDSAGDDLKQLRDELLPLLLLDVGLQPELLPQFLRALDNIGVGLRGFALLDELLLLRMRFS